MFQMNTQGENTGRKILTELYVYGSQGAIFPSYVYVVKSLQLILMYNLVEDHCAMHISQSYS